MTKKITKVYLVAGFLTVVLYSMGVLTGLFIQRNILFRTEEEIERIREEFDVYRKNLENIQLEQLYITTYKGELSCNFLISVINDINDDLSYFWSKLPPRLEEYEKYSQIQPEYEKLKRDYVLLSIRVWLLSLNIKEKCGKDIIPVLYIYSGDCDNCVEQGIVLDKLKKKHKEFSAAVVDFNMDEPIVKIIKSSYNITEVPSFVINNKAYQGFKTLSELEEIILIN